jgi:hypothetical protein
VESSPDRIHELLDWILELPPGAAREVRLVEAANGNLVLEGELKEYVFGLEKLPWLPSALRVYDVRSSMQVFRTGQKFGVWQVILWAWGRQEKSMTRSARSKERGFGER